MHLNRIGQRCHVAKSIKLKKVKNCNKNLIPVELVPREETYREKNPKLGAEIDASHAWPPPTHTHTPRPKGGVCVCVCECVCVWFCQMRLLRWANFE